MSALEFTVTARCAVTKARVASLRLPHAVVDTPVFMPVGTQGSLKCLTPDQLKNLGCKIMLGNTYHLGHRPGTDVLSAVGGLHSFAKWDRALLTDSGGFQMVSLAKLMTISEEGCSFESPHDGSMMMLTPEHSMAIQNCIGADIMMQLDDVVHSCVTGPRVEEAMWRSIRWLDRCVSAHKQTDRQNLFAIIQGGLDSELRVKCLDVLLSVPTILPYREMTKRPVPGFAIGGLSGGEEKEKFWRIVSLCTDHLPKDKPRYLMGVGYAVDLVVCSALGCDMFDCVYPTRTARFGTALTFSGPLDLTRVEFSKDHTPIEEECDCSTCQKYTRANIFVWATRDPTCCQLLTIHNVSFQLRLMSRVRAAITEGTFPEFVQTFMTANFPERNYPVWVTESLSSVGITLL